MSDLHIPHHESCDTCGTPMDPADIPITHEVGNQRPLHFCSAACYMLWATEEDEGDLEDYA